MQPVPRVPSVRDSRISGVTNEHAYLLFWVKSGSAHMDVEGYGVSDHHHLQAGEALLLPPGVIHSAHVDMESVALPLLLPETENSQLPTATKIVQVPTEWEDWLVWVFAQQHGYLRGTAGGDVGLMELVGGPQPAENTDAPLPLPTSETALEVARCLLRNPGDNRTLPQYAGRLAINTRTLQRQFQKDTGMNFNQWRQRVRIHAAMVYLIAGRPISWTGQAVGFRTPAGFTRAFQSQTGLSPSTFVERNVSTRPRSAIPDRDTMLSQAVHDLSCDAPGHGTAAPPEIPATSTWERINNFHIGLWMYRGSAVARLGSRTVSLSQGNAIRVPAGIRHSIELAPHSILFPVWSRPAEGVEIMPDSPPLISFPPEYDTYLLHHVVSYNTALRPLARDDRDLIDLFLSAEETPVPEQAPEAVRRIVESLHRDPSDNQSLEQWAQRMGVRPADLQRQFTQVTGDSLTLWRAKLRMSRARIMLNQGEAASTIARRLGYAHPSGFTKTFKATFGMPPREYVRHRREQRRVV